MCRLILICAFRTQALLETTKLKWKFVLWFCVKTSPRRSKMVKLIASLMLLAVVAQVYGDFKCKLHYLINFKQNKGRSAEKNNKFRRNTQRELQRNPWRDPGHAPFSQLPLFSPLLAAAVKPEISQFVIKINSRFCFRYAFGEIINRSSNIPILVIYKTLSINRINNDNFAFCWKVNGFFETLNFAHGLGLVVEHVFAHDPTPKQMPLLWRRKESCARYQKCILKESQCWQLQFAHDSRKQRNFKHDFKLLQRFTQ